MNNVQQGCETVAFSNQTAISSFLYKETNMTLLRNQGEKLFTFIFYIKTKQMDLTEQYLTNYTHRQLDDELQHSEK